MPNWVTTEIRCSDQRALSGLINDAGEVDFNLLVPQPENMETGNCSGNHAPGVICWYEWSNANWGTKWNAHTEVVEEGFVRFDTAWGHPFPVIKALSEKFSDAVFEVSYADEDLGHNFGRYTIQAGVDTEVPDRPADGSDEACDFASQLKYGQSYAELSGAW